MDIITTPLKIQPKPTQPPPALNDIEHYLKILMHLDAQLGNPNFRKKAPQKILELTEKKYNDIRTSAEFLCETAINNLQHSGYKFDAMVQYLRHKHLWSAIPNREELYTESYFDYVYRTNISIIEKLLVIVHRYYPDQLFENKRLIKYL